LLYGEYTIPLGYLFGNVGTNCERNDLSRYARFYSKLIFVAPNAQ